MFSRRLSLARMGPALLALLCLLAPLAAQTPGPDENGPRLVTLRRSSDLVAQPAVVDFGHVWEGERLTRVLSFTNRGQRPYAIRQVSTSCGCTLARVTGPQGTSLPAAPRPDGKPVAVLTPGQSLLVEVEFLTTNQHGQVQKSVKVVPMDPASQPVAVPVRAHVSRALTVKPRVLDLGRVTKSQPVEQWIVVDSEDIGPWKLTGVQSARGQQPLPPFLKFEIVDEEGAQRRIRLRLDGTRLPGRVSANVRILVEHERIGFVDFYVTGHVMSDVVFSSEQGTFPAALDFQQVLPGEHATRTLTIHNSDPTMPYELLAADVEAVDPEHFTVDIRTLQAGTHYEVDLTVDSSLAQSFFRGRLMLRAEHPDVPTTSVPFHGWIKASTD